MKQNDLTPLIEDLLYAEEFGLLEDPVGRAARRAIDAGVTDSFVIGIVHERVKKHKVAQAFAGEFRIPQLSQGDVQLGFAKANNHPIHIPAQYANGHSLTLGGSGCGKTTKAKWLVLQMARNVSGLWLFDMRKEEFGSLVPAFSQLGIELIVVPARDLRLNPLQVPYGIDPRDWSPRVADMLVQVLRLPPRATKLLHVTLLDLFDKFGVLQGGERFPTLFELRNAIAGNDQANAPARQAVIDALDPVLFSLRSVLCYRRGWSTGNDLGKRHLVFELGGIAEADKDLILNSLILPEFASRIARGISNPKMDLFIVCDEAQRLVSANSPTGGVGDLISLVRGTGIGLDLAVNSADIAPSILSNTACKFIGRCGSASDYDLIGGAMGLTSDQRRALTHTLVPGLFVGQVGEGPWRHPFLFRVPREKTFGGIRTVPPTLAGLPLLSVSSTGGSLGNSTAAVPTSLGLNSLQALAVDPAPEFMDWKPGRPSSVSHGPPSCTVSVQMTDAEVRFLSAVVEHPGQPSSAYAKLSGVGTHQAIALRKQLVAQGYLREHAVNASGRGRASIVLEPLPPAIEAVHRDRKGC